MSKVKLLVPLASATGAYNIGDEYECSKDEAVRFIDACYAVPVRQANTKETATRKTPAKEKAVK